MKTQPIHIQNDSIGEFGQMVAQKLDQFIVGDDHPCVMAQGVIRGDNYTIHPTSDLHSAATVKDVLRALWHYIDEVGADERNFKSFIVALDTSELMVEEDFEKLLWTFLQKLHERDTSPWDTTVSADPSDHSFSFSLHGTAFYIVGMHPGSSRPARQFPYPIIVFNLHRQFEALRQMGVYTDVRDRIRERDKEQNGSVNPMLADFGSTSEAAQYSGRVTGKEWKCPFHAKQNLD